MKKLFIVLLPLFLFSCGQAEKKPPRQWITIEIGDYLFDFPADFKLVKEKGIDSYVGRIKGDSMFFQFDFGYYSNRLEQTPQEFLDKGYWRLVLPLEFMKEGVAYDQSNTPKVDVINIRPASVQDSSIAPGCDYVAKCKYGKITVDFGVYIPDETKQMNFAVDTLDKVYRKIVWAKDPQKGTTGIYLEDLNSFNGSINNTLALSMSADKLTTNQQETALKIFRTGRRKREGH